MLDYLQVWNKRMQSKKMSHLEILTNQIAGIIIGCLIGYLVFPLYGIKTTATDATISTIIFFFASYTRAYLIRRFFNYIQIKQYNKG